ncbi:hypothetical protein BIW11_12428, partial [Tropilaelaps mercedesae]
SDQRQLSNGAASDRAPEPRVRLVDNATKVIVGFTPMCTFSRQPFGLPEEQPRLAYRGFIPSNGDIVE